MTAWPSSSSTSTASSRSTTRAVTWSATSCCAARLGARLRRATAQAGRTVSVGLALARPTDVATAGVEALRGADIALYEAKRAGRDRVAVYDERLHPATRRRVELATDLDHAAERGELFVVYQPVFDLVSYDVLGVEALARWRHPTRGVLGPAEFIPLAEGRGRISEIDAWVLREACVQAREWNARLGPDRALKVGVNVSVSALSDRLPARVAATLRGTGLESNSLVLELTESVMVGDEAAVESLRRLRATGVHLAIDDFGTGYSSLSYLRRLPVDILKIDRTFVAGLAERSENAAVARAILDLGRSLGLSTVAEGIERVEQVELLRELGCEHGQGFLLSRPLTATAFGERFVPLPVAAPVS